jgi:hypothetical protein
LDDLSTSRSETIIQDDDLSNPSLQNAPGIEQHRFTPNITPISSANERPKPGNGNWTNVIPVVDVETDTNISSSEDELSTANQGNRKTTCELARESYEVYLVSKTTQANRETNRQNTR